jgi:dolichol kinase
MDQESKRKTIHISMGFLALLLAVFPRWLSLIVVLIALFFIVVIARPTMWKRGFNAMASRTRDVESGYLYGPLLYILMVLVSVLILDLRIAGAVFSIMAFGDGFANVIGTRFGNHRFKNFQNKSLEGSIAFVIFAFVSSTISFFVITINPDLATWVPFLNIKSPEEINTYFIIIVTFLVSVLAAIIELTLSEKMNDNLTVPIVSGTVLTLLLKL